jgi:hypothetical protein
MGFEEDGDERAEVTRLECFSRALQALQLSNLAFFNDFSAVIAKSSRPVKIFQERGQPCPRASFPTPVSRGQGCPRSFCCGSAALRLCGRELKRNEFRSLP